MCLAGSTIFLHETNGVENSFVFNRTKVIVLKVCLSLTQPSTWTTSIIANSMYFESLWLTMANAKTLHQNVRIGLSSLPHAKLTQNYTPFSSWKKRLANQGCVLGARYLGTNLPHSPTLSRDRRWPSTHLNDWKFYHASFIFVA